MTDTLISQMPKIQNIISEELLIPIDKSYLEHLRKASRSAAGAELDEVCLIEFIKFFRLATNFPLYKIQISREIDLVWHAAILETKQYRNLNETLNNGNFLDHSVLDSESGSKYHSIDEEQDDFDIALNYFHQFGGFTKNSLDFWPQARKICERNRINYGNLNNILSAAISDALNSGKL